MDVPSRLLTGDPGPETLLRFREALVGRLGHGVVLAPPPVQTELLVWLAAPGAASDPPIVADSPTELVVFRRPARSPSPVTLPATGASSTSGVTPAARTSLCRGRGRCGYWPVILRPAQATSDFPSVVADLADELAPFEPDPD